MAALQAEEAGASRPFSLPLRSSLIARVGRAAIHGWILPLRPSLIAEVKWAAIHGRTFQWTL
jgi:hypothetical protein